MIVWGSGGDRVNLGISKIQYCSMCEKERPFNIILQYRYWGLYWIFNAVTEKKYLLVCEVCQRGWELESDKVEATLKSVPIPFMYRYGLLVLISSVIGLGILAAYLPTTVNKDPLIASATTSVPRPTSTRKAGTVSPTPTTTMTINKKKEMLSTVLDSLIESPEYDKNSNVLHKHINSIRIRLIGKTLTFIIQPHPDTVEEFAQLGAELILAGTLTSQPGESGDWGLIRIEVMPLGPSDSSAKLYVAGQDNLVELAQGEVNIYDVMEIEIDWPYALAEVIVSSLNIRSGPGVDYQIIGSLSVGNQLQIVGTNSTRDWLQVTDSQRNIGWISGNPEYTRVFGSLNNVPVVQVSSPGPTSAGPTPTQTQDVAGIRELMQCLVTTPPDQRDQCYEQSNSNGNVPAYPNQTQECVSWMEAVKHINETTCVWGVVTSTYDSENAFFINFSETDYSSFYGVSFDYSWNNLKGQCVVLYGLIQTYEGRPEIIIEQATQLEFCND